MHTTTETTINGSRLLPEIEPTKHAPGSTDWLSQLIQGASLRATWRGPGGGLHQLATAGVQVGFKDGSPILLDVARNTTFRPEELAELGITSLEFLLERAGFPRPTGKWELAEQRLLVLMQSWSIATGGGSLKAFLTLRQDYLNWLRILDDCEIEAVLTAAASITNHPDAESPMEDKAFALGLYLDRVANEKKQRS